MRQTLDYDIEIHWSKTMQVTLTLELSWSDQNNFEANQYILVWYSGNILYHCPNVFLLFLYIFYHEKQNFGAHNQIPYKMEVEEVLLLLLLLNF